MELTDAAEMVERAVIGDLSTCETCETCEKFDRSGLGSRPDEDIVEEGNRIEGISISGLRRRDGFETAEKRREAETLACERLAEADADAGSESSASSFCCSVVGRAS